MSPWRSSGLTCAALLLACIKPNPAFDDDASAGASASAGPTSATSDPVPPTTSATIPTTTTSGVSDSDSGTTSPPTTTASTTTGVQCGLLNEPCGASNCCTGCGLCMAGTCMPDPSVCGPCGVCGDDSQCTPQPMSTPCKLADDPCAGKIWGLDNGVCFANAPGAGLCDGGDQCLPQACTQGDKLVGCDAACIIDPANCAADMPVAQVDPNLLCAQDGPTPDCKLACIPGNSEDKLFNYSCKAGLCTPLSTTSCGKYTCLDEQTCDTNCDNNGDCKQGFCNRSQLCQ